MPVTAKLSSSFYEKLGDDVTNELVAWLNAVDAEFRNELRDANDRNWDRLRAELETLSARLTGEFRGGLAELRTELRTGLAEGQKSLGVAQAGFKASLADFRTETNTSIADFRTETNTSIANFRMEVRTDISNLRVEMHQGFTKHLRWTFGFWVMTVLTIAGLKLF